MRKQRRHFPKSFLPMQVKKGDFEDARKGMLLMVNRRFNQVIENAEYGDRIAICFEIKIITNSVIEPNHRKSSEYRKWRNAVLDRDDYRCQQCFSDNVHLNAHHILPYAKHPERRTDIENGVTLCLNCHALTHHPKVTKVTKHG